MAGGRLIVLDPDDFRGPAGLAGFIASPLWYIGVGLALLPGRKTDVADTAPL
jgi:hypothetical protein